MRRTGVATIRTGVALGVALATAAGANAQVPTVSIEDVRVVEGNSTWSQQVTVTLSEPAPGDIDVYWHTVGGSATGGTDFIPRPSGSGPIHFSLNDTTQTLSVLVVGDTVDDDPAHQWSTTQMDEAFFIELEPPPPVLATLLKSRATVTIVDDDDQPSPPELQFVSAVADVPGTPPGGRVRLQWRVPASSTWGPVTDVLVRWTVDTGSGCSAPTSDTGGTIAGEFRLSDPPTPIPLNLPGETQVVEHTGLPFRPHCYALFAIYSVPPPTPPRATVVARPMDPGTLDGQSVAWTYSVAGSLPSVVPPTVGTDAVYTISNDGVVHAMGRGEAVTGGGAWPPGWNPVGLGKEASNRSPVVPLPYGPRLFVGTRDGEVHAINGLNGAVAWSRSQAFGNTQLSTLGGVVQATPAGLFTSFTGLNDLILVGTNDAPPSNQFHMLDPVTGLDRSAPLGDDSMGAIMGMAAVDYGANGVHFLTTSTSATLWFLDLGDPPSFTVPTSPVGFASGGGANGSPVVRNGRLYFGLNNGDIVAYRLSNGTWSSIGGLGGQVNGFVFPDRRNTRLYFSTSNSRVWGATDTVDPSNPNLNLLPWVVADIMNPSIVLLRPGTDFLYVGGRDALGHGRLYEINVASPNPQATKKSVLLEPDSRIGSPSLDGPNNLVLVGSSTGVVYAVRVPLP